MNPLWVVILTLGLLVAPLAAGAQHAKVPVIGVLMVSAGPKDSVVGSFRQGLRDQGYVEGRNVAIEFRSAAGRTDRLPRLAKELVDRRVDVIFSAAEPALLALKHATTAVPIVMVAYHFDPVASGLIASTARPGGNITGVFPLHTELLGKRLQLLKQAFRESRASRSCGIRSANMS